MKNTYKRKMTLDSNCLDIKEEPTIEYLMQLLQDVANDHCTALGIDRWSLIKNSNAFWVATKVKLQINRPAKLGEKLSFETWTQDPTAVKFERDAKLACNGKTLVGFKSEWVDLDYSTHKIRPAKTLAYPFDMKNRKDRAIEGKFNTLNHTTAPNDFCYSRIIRVGDLDVNNHVNNCFYSRFVFDCFGSEEYKTKKVQTYEIHFINECHEGEQLDFYKLQTEEGTFVEAKVGDKQIIKALITWKQ